MLSNPRFSAPVTYCFAVHARAEPGVMPRVLNLFAKRGLVPDQWHSALAGPRGDEIQIDLQVRGLAPRVAAHIAGCLRAMPDVAVVLTSEKRSPPETVAL